MPVPTVVDTATRIFSMSIPTFLKVQYTCQKITSPGKSPPSFRNFVNFLIDTKSIQSEGKVTCTCLMREGGEGDARLDRAEYITASHILDGLNKKKDLNLT